MVEILPETPLSSGLLEVRTRGGDDPAVRRLGPDAAEAADHPLVERGEELGLRAFRQEPDLVEKEGAAMGLLKQAEFRLPASVKAPRSKPKSSASRRVSGIAAQFTLTNDALARGLAACRARARRLLPVPVSPCRRTGGTRRAVATRESRRRTWAWMATIPELWPIKPARGSIKRRLKITHNVVGAQVTKVRR
jgi:hypothetical protein